MSNIGPLSHRTVTPAVCRVQSQICLYTVFTLNLFPESPPSFELHKCRCTRHDQWANLSEFEQASESCREKQAKEKRRRRGEKFFSEWRLRWCVVLILLLFCVKFFGAVCSLVISLRWQNGRGAESRPRMREAYH